MSENKRGHKRSMASAGRYGQVFEDIVPIQDSDGGAYLEGSNEEPIEQLGPNSRRSSNNEEYDQNIGEVGFSMSRSQVQLEQ